MVLNVIQCLAKDKKIFNVHDARGRGRGRGRDRGKGKGRQQLW